MTIEQNNKFSMHFCCKGACINSYTDSQNRRMFGNELRLY